MLLYMGFVYIGFLDTITNKPLRQAERGAEAAMSERLDLSNLKALSDLKTMLRALAAEDRLNIVHHLAWQGEVNVTEICQSLDISQPLVSWHLAMLRRANLVRTRRLGRQVYCSLDMARFQRCLQWLASLVEPSASEPEPTDFQLHGERVQS